MADHQYPREFYEACYDLLVADGHCRAESFMRGAFITFFTESDRGPKEFRFQGHLGFGGKFWRSHRGHDVTCYPEDLSKDRDAMIKRLNAKLAELEARWQMPKP